MGAGASFEGATDPEKVAEALKLYEAKKAGGASEEELATYMHGLISATPGGVAMAEAADFDKKCTDLVGKAVSQNSRSIIFGVDGSDGCKLAFDVVMDVFSGNDFINVVHVADGKSNFEELKLAYEAHLAPKMLKSHYSIGIIGDVTSNDPANVKEMLVSYVTERTTTTSFTPDSNRPDATLFACGFVGKKMAEGSAEVIGSTADLGLRSIPTPCLVVKKPISDPKAKTFLLLSDGSERAWNGYRYATQMMKPTDSIEVVQFHEPGADVTASKERYEKNITLSGFAGSSFKAIEAAAPKSKEGNEAPAPVDAIKEYLLDKAADFVVLAPRPAKLLENKTSLVDTLIDSIPTSNFLLIKN